MYQTPEQLLASKSVSMYKVSKDTGISQATLSDWKNGKTLPKAAKLLKLAKYFDVAIEDLIPKE